MKLFKHVEKAYFKKRLNRFLVSCEKGDKTIEAYLPNPGRLWELLWPGRMVYLAKNNSRTEYTAIAVKKDDSIVMLHTHRVNDLVEWFIKRKIIPGLDAYEVERREVSIGNSRFDFLLRKGDTPMMLEVKSCTLFHRGVAMFPDAETKRGTRHLEELVKLKERGIQGGILFIVSTDEVDYFLPEYHTDLEFARALYYSKDSLFITAQAIKWDNDFKIEDKTKELRIPWQILDKELKDRGSYLLILSLSKDREITVGGLGDIRFKKGYYVYVGSAERALSARMERHKRKRKKMHWHIDYLRNEAEVVSVLAIRSSERLECKLSEDLRHISSETVEGFGASDCGCFSHLYYFEGSPIVNVRFINLLLHYRMGRLKELLCQR